jgi:CheY-like chemotaxis protein
MSGSLDCQEFKSLVLRALQHLYDPIELRRSPLVRLFHIDRQAEIMTAFRQIFLEAIRRLKPASDVPSDSPAWRIYQVLSYRYIEQSSQKEVASDFAMSTRQLRRLEKVAIDELARILMSQYQLDLSGPVPSGEDEPALFLHEVPKLKDSAQITNLQNQELEWLKKFSLCEEVEMHAIMDTVLETTRPLFRTLDVEVKETYPENIPNVSAHFTSLRQALLNIVILSARFAVGKSIHFTIRFDPHNVFFSIRAERSKGTSTVSEDEIADCFHSAHQLIAISNGLLDIVDDHSVSGIPPGSLNPQGGCLNFHLKLPIVNQIPVLVIDDSTDSLRLFERYLAGSCYRFLGIRDPLQALDTAVTLEPKVIVLDVMLPVVDGWGILGRLREHPKTQKIPVIICSILPQETLAYTLGAADFVRKPVSCEVFLRALNQQVARSG